MPFLQDQDASFVRNRFAQDLRGDVTLEFFAPATGGLVLPGQDGETADYARQILVEVAALSPKIRLNVHSMVAEPEVAKAFGIARTPATAVIGARDFGVRFYGMPAGYEFATLLELIITASQGTAAIAPQTREMLGQLQHDIHLQVFVTPTWPHCPRAARLAALLAVESLRVRTDIVEASEFPDLAERYNVYAVPKIVINDTVEFVGAQPEPHFMRYVAQAGGVQEAPPADAESM